MRLIFLPMVALLVYQVDAGCKVPVDCSNLPAGVTLADCFVNPPTPPAAPPGPATSPIEVDCCEEVTFTGPARKQYTYNGGCPVVLEFLEVDLDDGEVLIIKNIYCTDDPDKCQMYIIDNTVTTKFKLEISSSGWSFHAQGDTVNIVFQVIGPDCPTCAPECDDGWSEHDGGCYKLFSQLKPWDWLQTKCANLGGSIAYGYDQAAYDFISGMAPPFTHSGLHCVDPNNTAWYWDTPNGPVLNTIADIWDSGYPFASINAHCAFYPFDHGGKLENANCDVQRKGICVKPLE